MTVNVSQCIAQPITILLVCKMYLIEYPHQGKDWFWIQTFDDHCIVPPYPNNHLTLTTQRLGQCHVSEPNPRAKSGVPFRKDVRHTASS